MCSHFSVNILSEGQEKISNIFATSDDDRFTKVPHKLDFGGYIAKVSLPLFCVLMAVAVSKKNNQSLISLVLRLCFLNMLQSRRLINIPNYLFHGESLPHH